jgi:hypothetical protein
MQHSNLPPVIHVFMFNGQPVNVRRACGGSYEDAAVAFVETMLPQNNAISKVVNHAIAEDCGRRPNVHNNAVG